MTRRIRLARYFYQFAWRLCRHVAASIKTAKRPTIAAVVLRSVLLARTIREAWVVILIFGFGLLGWSLRLPLSGPADGESLWSYLYFSGTTFFTLGYGDVTPNCTTGRILAVAESGLGFGFLAAVISYLPAMSQAYSNRELTISLLDARAGSPPSAAELLVRLGHSQNLATVQRFLEEWERWSGDLLESQLSFPVLGYYRSQHDNQSWLSTLTFILDVCAILIVHQDRRQSYQAQLTFAMARHAAVDLGIVMFVAPPAQMPNRLDDQQKRDLYRVLQRSGHCILNPRPMPMPSSPNCRGLYEPFIFALADRLLFIVPRFYDPQTTADNWQRSGWMGRALGDQETSLGIRRGRAFWIECRS